MTDADMQALEAYQASTAGATERRISDLVNVADDLSSLCQTREGIRIIRASHPQLKETLRKLHDIYLDTQPVTQAAE